MAMIALIVAVVNRYHPFVVPTRDSTAFTDSLTVFNTFLGLIVSFRMNSAFTQWRAGVVAVGSLSEAARDIVGSGCAYVSTTIKNELTEATNKAEPEHEGSTKNDNFKASNIPQDVLEKCTFFTELRRLVFLYIAIVFHDCRGLDGIDKLKEAGVLTDAEYDELYACGSEHKMQVEDKESYRAIVRRTPHKLRATITELWLKRLVQVATNRGHLTLPNANALQLKLARLPNLYTTVFNIANVPIPFNYMQYLQFLLTAYMLLYTFVIVPRSGLYTPLWVFMWGTFLFMADEVAMEIECPFGLDANDIDLEARLLQIEEELTVLIRSQYYFVSGGTSLTRIPEISVPENSESQDKPCRCLCLSKVISRFTKAAYHPRTVPCFSRDRCPRLTSSQNLSRIQAGLAATIATATGRILQLRTYAHQVEVVNCFQFKYMLMQFPNSSLSCSFAKTKAKKGENTHTK
ncbi:Adenylate cyclase [Phytophthora nicotianae]|uniref:Adenylate cyclase n=1 Tax=Phytophthora nicotianae TaxID=4792 RepID=A0A0W8DS87_PHYNI|nr:Adenylate cyclase [Phytophthora nicotianae]